VRHFTLKELEKQFRLPARKVAYLIRNGLIKPMIQGGKILVPEPEILRYFGLPEEVKKSHHNSYLKTLGPGMVTGAADNDCSGIGTYSQVGSTYGLGLSWLAVYLLPMMTAVQETVARIGIVTGRGLSGVIGKYYGRRVLYPLVGLLFIANTINIGADIGAMAASLQLLVPVNFVLAAIGITLVMIVLEIRYSYHQYSKVLKWLTLSLLGYIVTGFLVRPDWLEIFRALSIPKIELTPGFLFAMVAVMGTTISPYLFFWQASEEIEEEKENGTDQDHRKVALTKEIKEMRRDTFAGMSYANIVFLFIIITTATVFFKNGIFNIETAEQAAAALKPLAGNFASVIFTVGIIGVGLLAVPVLAGSSAYAIAEMFKWHEGLSKRYTQARGFYGVILWSMLIGLAMNFIGINPIKALFWAAVVNGLVSPVLLFFIFRLGNNKKIMGDFSNPRWVNFFGVIVTALMGGAAILLIGISLF
jgi:Mn2+/Fe2+ NRAMP family transporter